MGFDVAGTAYGRFIGRFSEPLGADFLTFAGVDRGDRALDVGCGPGALTERLAALLGASRVAASDPSDSFVAATRARCPGVDVRNGVAENLPHPDGTFDVALAQLVVHFMRDPIAGLREMTRVTRSAGTVAACVWDHGGGTGPLSLFWNVVSDLDAGATGESTLAGVHHGDLERLFTQTGLTDIHGARLTVRVEYDSFQEWWEPYTLGVGSVGDYLSGLSAAAQDRVRERCAERLPEAPFTIVASAWAARGTTPGPSMPTR